MEEQSHSTRIFNEAYSLKGYCCKQLIKKTEPYLCWLQWEEKSSPLSKLQSEKCQTCTGVQPRSSVKDAVTHKQGSIPTDTLVFWQK